MDELWSDALAQIGEVWFGIKIPRQRGNPLFDMMGSMMFGGNQAKTSTPARSSTPKPAQAQIDSSKAKEKPPVAMDLD